MNDILIQAVNLSISASYLVLAVLLLRPLLKKAPRWISVALWGLVGLRLMFPFSIESIMSLQPSAQTIPQNVTATVLPNIQGSFPVMEGGFATLPEQPVTGVVTPGILPEAAPVATENPLQTWLLVAGIVWVVGIVAMLSYTTVSYLRLRRQVFDAVREEKNIYRSERIATPFVLGFFRPRIYLPMGLSEGDLPHVIAHEQAHIARRDHWIKPLGFVLLSLYWFNPVLWVAYILLCRDIETACDERVIRTMGADLRIDYSQALLSCSVSRKSIAACPLAFGEGSVKARIKSVLHYKHPGFWITLVALVLCGVLAVSFLTDPVQADQEELIPGQTEPAQTEPAATQPAEQVPALPVVVPDAPPQASYTPLPGESSEVKETKFFKPVEDSWWWDAVEKCTPEEAEAVFGKPGVRLNNYRDAYYWLVDGYSVLLWFDGQDYTAGAYCYHYGRLPENIEQVRQDFLDISPEDVQAVTVTGLNSLGSSVTAQVPEALAREAIVFFQNASQDAAAVGLYALDFMSRAEQYLTISMKDGQQVTVEFSQLLRIGQYWFAPTAECQDAFYSELYQQLVVLLAEPLRQQLLQLHTNHVQLALRPLKKESSGENLDQAALLTCLQKILGEFDHYYGEASYGADGRDQLKIEITLYDYPMSVYVLKEGYVMVDGFAYRVNTYDGWWRDLINLYETQ